MRKELDDDECFALWGKPGETLDDDWRDYIDELIREEGCVIGRHQWDSGGPGAGAGELIVSLFRGFFIAWDDIDTLGPYQTFEEAADAVGFYRVTDATRKIWVDPSIKTDRQIPLLRQKSPPSSTDHDGRKCGEVWVHR